MKNIYINNINNLIKKYKFFFINKINKKYNFIIIF